jgi:hypothetical protein
MDELDESGGKLQRGCAAHLGDICAKNIDAQRAFRIDQLQHGFAGRVVGMDTTEQEIISQTTRNGIERGGHEIDVV